MMLEESNPFVGLRPFEPEESLLFFGRQEQTRDLLQRLHLHHFVAVVGSSGSGKSSIIRAGLIPSLKAGYLVKDRDNWMIAVMKPGQSPLCNLAEAILSYAEGQRPDLSVSSLEQLIKEEGADVLFDILEPLWAEKKSFFLLVDQFEELFRFSLNQPEVERKDEAIDFVNILLELSSKKELPVYTVITMRSDFIGDCSEFYGLPEAINQSQYLVPRLSRIQLKSAIEGPVRLSNGKISTGLLARLLNDAQTIKDELPLVQHALMRIWDRDRQRDNNNELDLTDYESIGGLEKALSNHADEALVGMSPEDLQLTRKIFQALTTVDENERKVRRPVRISELEALTGTSRLKLLSIINCFIESKRSFLVIAPIHDKNDMLIDISHESLIRQWKTLNDWVNEENESAKLLHRLHESAELYDLKEKSLLTGNELGIMLHWYNEFKPAREWATRYHPDFDAAIAYLEQSKKEEQVRRTRRKRSRALLFGSMLLVLVLVSLFAVYIYKAGVTQKKELALTYWKSATGENGSDDQLASLHYLAESVDLNTNPDVANALLMDAEVLLPPASLEGIVAVKQIINDVQLNQSNTHAIVALNNGTAQVIELATGKIVTQVRQSKPLNSVAFSSSGSLFVTAGNDGNAVVWNPGNASAVVKFKHPAAVNSAVFNRLSTMVLTAGADSCARLWNLATGKALVLRQEWPVVNAAFNPTTQSFIVAGTEQSLVAYDSSGANKVFTIYQEAAIRAAVYNYNGSQLITANNDSTLRFYDASNGELLFSSKQPDVVGSLAMSADGKWIVTGGKDGYLRVVDATTGFARNYRMKHDGPVYGIAFSNDQQRIISGGWDGLLRVWSWSYNNSQHPVHRFKHTGFVTSARFSPDEKLVVSSGNDSTARIWDLLSTNKQGPVLRHRSYVNTAMFNNTGSELLTSSYDSTARIWNLSGKEVFRMLHPSMVIDAAYSDDGTKVVTVAGDQVVRTWRKVENSFIAVDSFRINSLVNSARFAPGDAELLIACADSAAYIVTRSGKPVRTFRHDDAVKYAEYNLDGTQVLTASFDKTARLWNASTGKQVGPAMRSDNFMNSASFSPGGSFIVTAGWDKKAHIFNTLTMHQTGAPIEETNGLNGAVFNRAKTSVLTAGRDSTATIWKIGGDLDLPARVFHLQVKVLSGTKFDLATGEARCMDVAEWTTLKNSYQKAAAAHAKVCKYPEYNYWRQHYQKDKQSAANK